MQISNAFRTRKVNRSGPKKFGSNGCFVRLILLLTITISLFTWAPHASACMVCVPFPTRTAADDLIASEVVVFARENPERPYTFIVAETLKGVANNEPINLLLNSTTRRQLFVDPTSYVVLTRPTSGSRWRWHSFADKAYQDFVRHVLTHIKEWRQSQNQRFDYFETLLSSNNERLCGEAVLEIGRGPYSRIKAAASKISRKRLYEVLGKFAMFEWWPTYIVMLGQSQLAEDKAYVRANFMRSAKTASTKHLAAWTTAFVEVDGAEAVSFISEKYFAGKRSSRALLVEMQKALSVLGSESDNPLRPLIVAAYRKLLETHRSMAGYVAKDLAAWRDWSLAPLFEELRARQAITDPGTRFIVSYYLSIAHKAYVH